MPNAITFDTPTPHVKAGTGGRSPDTAHFNFLTDGKNISTRNVTFNDVVSGRFLVAPAALVQAVAVLNGGASGAHYDGSSEITQADALACAENAVGPNHSYAYMVAQVLVPAIEAADPNVPTGTPPSTPAPAPTPPPTSNDPASRTLLNQALAAIREAQSGLETARAKVTKALEAVGGAQGQPPSQPPSGGEPVRPHLG
jgi:hypothetical protein